MPLKSIIPALLALGLSACASTYTPTKSAEPTQEAEAKKSISVNAPSDRLSFTLSDVDGSLKWAATWNGHEIISPSALGLRFAEGRDLTTGLVIAETTITATDTSWEQPWGERTIVRDHHNKLTAKVLHADRSPAYTLEVKVFDDGLGFRYLVPATGKRIITDEITEFRYDDTSKTWWIPAAGWNRYEELYEETELKAVHRAHTPLTSELPGGGPFISIHEAALVDYAGMWLNQRRRGVLEADLAPWSDGAKVKVNDAFTTPWRTLQVAETAAGLANSDLILNLNAPNKLGDVSWAKPSKYVGIWWCMHIEECTWGSGEKHGATTDRTKAYIDFAAKHGFDGVLVEGWNEGWDGSWFDNGEVFSFTKPYPDFDLEGLAAYAKSKGVYLIGHHETSGAITNYEEQIEAAYALYQRLGIPAIKSGYVADGGDLTRRDADGKAYFEWHDGQFAFSREGARGQEYNAWGQPPNDPAHTTILPFTRMLSGPMDFTPGIFDLNFGKPVTENPRVQTTLAKQLALYVILHSPIQMAADLPRNYEARPEAFQFIKDVPVDWAQSITLDGYPGDFIVTARKDRNSNAWLLGAITNEAGRTIEVDLSFLDGFAYEAQIYRDGQDADWLTNPYSFETAFETVSENDSLTLTLAPGGGTAIAFIPVE